MAQDVLPIRSIAGWETGKGETKPSPNKSALRRSSSAGPVNPALYRHSEKCPSLESASGKGEKVMARYSKQEIEESRAALRKLCPPGTTVYTVLRHVSRSGMMRNISLQVVKAGNVQDITWHVARVLGYPIRHASGWVQDRGLSVNGCGMDMGFHLVNALSYALHGRKPRGEGAAAENAGRFFKPRRGHYRAGYSLNHRWL